MSTIHATGPWALQWSQRTKSCHHKRGVLGEEIQSTQKVQPWTISHIQLRECSIHDTTTTHQNWHLRLSVSALEEDVIARQLVARPQRRIKSQHQHDSHNHHGEHHGGVKERYDNNDDWNGCIQGRRRRQRRRTTGQRKIHRIERTKTVMTCWSVLTARNQPHKSQTTASATKDPNEEKMKACVVDGKYTKKR